MNDLIRRKWNRRNDGQFLIGDNSRPSCEKPPDLTDAPQHEKRPSPNFVTNFLIPVWNIAFGHDELRERYLSLKPKR